MVSFATIYTKLASGAAIRQGFSHLCLSSHDRITEVRDTVFYAGSGDSNSGPHACVAYLLSHPAQQTLFTKQIEQLQFVEGFKQKGSTGFIKRFLENIGLLGLDI